MTKRNAKAMGRDAGYEAAAYCEMDEGMEGELTFDVIVAAAFEAEENSRQMSPFEFTAHDINEAGERADGLWTAYDDGVAAGIRAGARERMKAVVMAK